MLQHAQNYLTLGWSVFPIKPGSKRPLFSWKEFQDRLPDAEEVAEWYRIWPDAGIAVALGPVSSIVVADVDSIEAQVCLEELLGGLPRTRTALSGSRQPGKAHYYFQAPDFPTAARYTPLHPQLEFRGYGGAVVLPPSVHASGNRYLWRNRRMPILALPEPLAEVWRANPRFSGPAHTPSDHSAIAADPSECRSLFSMLRSRGLSDETQGWLLGCYAFLDGWNCRLFRAACDMNGCGVPIESATPHLIRGAKPRTDADREMALATIESAYAEPREPSRTFYPRPR